MNYQTFATFDGEKPILYSWEKDNIETYKGIKV
jgi:hypothetical protein